MIRIGAAFVLITTVLGTGFVISAQEAINQTPVSEVTFEQLQADYLFQIEQYNKAEDRFELDRAEYYKLQTLASREKAVESSRPYLEARARVLSTYLVALQYLLNQSQGVDIVAKNKTLDKIEEAKTYLRTYINQVPTISEQEEVNVLATSFEVEGTRLIFEAQYRTLSLLAIGPVQNAYDQLELATEDFKENFVSQIPEESQRARIERGLKDVDFHNSQADETLKLVVSQFPDFDEQTSSKVDFQSNYAQNVTNLQKTVASMRQSMRFLKELERQI